MTWKLPRWMMFRRQAAMPYPTRASQSAHEQDGPNPQEHATLDEVVKKQQHTEDVLQLLETQLTLLRRAAADRYKRE